MNTRLLEFIQYKTGGKQAEFAEIMGWSPQYLHNLLKGAIGIRPVVALLEKFPELNARWLLLDEGTMISVRTDKVKTRLLQLLEIEKYIPVMSSDELRELEEGKSDFDRETTNKWENLLKEKNSKIQARFDEAYKKQDELCNQKTVKE